MSEAKQRRRYRKQNKQAQEEKPRPVVLAKRDKGDERFIGNNASEVKPKILLKTHEKSDRKDLKETESSSSNEKNITIARSDSTQSPANLGPSPNTTKEQVAGGTEAAAVAVLIEPVPLMTRPSTIISSTGSINISARKLLMKTNSDFLVVGVIGTQGVGKSTIMNLLANEDHNYDYYSKIFVEEDSIFPTKLKPHKCLSRSRTESTHMFVTSDRIVLLDGPPVMCNAYKRDMITNELEDLHQIITLMSVCHLLVVVQDDFFNLSFMRLLHFAEIMKPTQDTKTLEDDYFPNLLFVKNRAKRQDFVKGYKENEDHMLRDFFKDSQLRVYRGQTVEKQNQKKVMHVPIEAERVVNSFYLPEIASADATPFHSSLANIVDEFRRLVFMTPRNELVPNGSNGGLVETDWFDMLSKVAKNTQHFSFNKYEEINRKHLEAGINTNTGNA